MKTGSNFGQSSLPLKSFAKLLLNEAVASRASKNFGNSLQDSEFTIKIMVMATHTHGFVFFKGRKRFLDDQFISFS